MFELIMLAGFGVAALSTLNKKEDTMLYSKPITPEFVKINCDVRAGNLNPCIKQQVYACIITEGGEYFFGANWMLNHTVTVCPRVTEGCATGTGYHLCEEVCGQGTEYHAERQAITACLEAGCNTRGATLYLTGHTYCCDTCKAAMKLAGIKTVVILDTSTTDQVVNY